MTMKTLVRRTSLASLALLAAVAAPVRAPAATGLIDAAAPIVAPQGDGPEATAEKTLTARRFARQAASGGKMITALARKARMQSFDPAVKRYARRVAGDHRRGMRLLMEAVEGKGIGVSSHMTDKHQGVLNSIARLKGPEFDRAFATQQVKAHRKSVDLFEDQLRHGTDPELRAFAARMLPTLREHLRMARELNATVSPD